MKNIADRRNIASSPPVVPDKPTPKRKSREKLPTNEDEVYHPEEQAVEVPRDPANAPEAPTDDTSKPAVEGSGTTTEKMTSKNPEESPSNEEDEDDSNEL